MLRRIVSRCVHGSPLINRIKKEEETTKEIHKKKKKKKKRKNKNVKNI